MQRQLLAQHLPIISGSIPALLEYQKQIEAHTANILTETMRIARSNEASYFVRFN